MHSTDPAHKSVPIFLVGHFRTGSTMFWNMFRSAGDSVRAYCEPFHEHLLEIVDDRHLIPEDPTHSGIEDYFAEYRHLDREVLGTLWKPWFGRERFMLERDDEAADMEAYLRFLIDSSPQRPVLKFTRATFRVEWLREKFPDSTIVHLERRPRDIWTSMWGRDWNVEGETSGSFIPYTRSMAEDIGLDLPGDLYRTFYALMLLGNEMSEGVADDVWVYEEAVGNYTTWGTRHLIEAQLMEALPQIAIRSAVVPADNHRGKWFDEQEEAVRSMVGNSVKQFLVDGDLGTRAS